MSGSTEDFKERPSTENDTESKTKTDRGVEDGRDNPEESKKQTTAQDEKDAAGGVEASATTKNNTEKEDSAANPTAADISMLLKAFQRVVQGSSSNITLKIEDTSEVSKAKATEDDEEDDDYYAQTATTGKSR